MLPRAARTRAEKIVHIRRKRNVLSSSAGANEALDGNEGVTDKVLPETGRAAELARTAAELILRSKELIRQSHELKQRSINVGRDAKPHEDRDKPKAQGSA